MTDSLTQEQHGAAAQNRLASTDKVMRDLGRKQSFHGPRLTRTQFDESFDIAGIIHSEIRATGRFKDKLATYAYGFSQSENFNPMKGEDIIRDAYKGRYSETMNQTRERYMATERLIDEDHTKEFVRAAFKESLERAQDMEALIRDGDTMPFYRAFDDQAAELSEAYGITEKKAKLMMKETFEETHGRALYDWGKELEQKYHRPKMQAAKAARETAKAERGHKRGQPRPR